MAYASPPTISHYSFFTDDSGFPVHSHFVDYRDPSNRTPITSLVKTCEKQFAFEECGTICISKPTKYRRFGETLVNDPSEGKHTEIIEDSEIVNDPHDISEGQARDDEHNQLAKFVGINSQRATRSTRTRRTRTQSLTFDKNGWIYCASIEPEGQKEKELLEYSLRGNDYNHTSFIRRPYEFALALGAMVVEQLGPQLGNVRSSVGLDGHDSVRTITRGQLIFHGPVVYVDDPFEAAYEAIREPNGVYLPFFIKSTEFQEQREYRFVIMTEEEPINEDEILNVSPAMAGVTRKLPESYPDNLESKEELMLQPGNNVESLPAPAYSDVRLESLGTNLPFVIDSLLPVEGIISDPSIPLSAKPQKETDTSGTSPKSVAIVSALKALREKVHLVTVARPLSKVAAAAFHAEPFILELCEVFQEPISGISEDNNMVILHIDFPPRDAIEVKLAISPSGHAAFSVYNSEGHLGSYYENSGRFGFQSIINELKTRNLPLRNTRSDSN